MINFAVRFLVFAAIHSVLAVPTVKDRIVHLLGRWGRWYRLGYNVMSLVLFAWVMSAWPHPPVLYFIPGIWGLLCYLFQFAAVAALFRCAARLDLPEFLGLRTPKRPVTLVKEGCYGSVRHPQYTLAIAVLVLNPVMTGRWLALTLLSIVYFLIGAWLEERRLLEELGDEYRRYRASVPMLIPRVEFRGKTAE